VVTAALSGADLDARAVTLAGWTELFGQRCLGFLHQVTLVGPEGVVVDLTGRQFGQQLPARWVAPFGDYAVELARATGCVEVTLNEL
jgi:hypothetical protein